MIYLWIVLGTLLLGTAVVVAVGMRMPERYEGRAQATYAKPPEEIWKALLDYERHPMTGKMKKSVKPLPPEDNLPVWVEDMGHGELITVKTVASEEPRVLAREMASQSVPMTSRWDYTLEPFDGGTRLTMDGETFIRKGTWHVPIFRIMMKANGGVKKGLDIQMDMLAQSLGVPAQRT